MRSWITGLIALGVAIIFQSALHADEKLTPAQTRFFESKIRPVLVRECYGCHSSEVGQVRGGLWLDTADGLRQGGDSGPAVIPNNLDDSLLWNALNHLDYQMPPRRKLSDEILADFKSWIEMGALDPRKTAAIEVKPGISDDDIKKGRQFWSFKRPKLPAVPQVGSDWAKTDIDRFVYDILASHAIQPAVDAQSETVLRRLTMDLVGLPPTPRQIQQFAVQWQEDPDQAISQLTDQLLNLPQFGERWGRHWLDLVRYAESTGREVNLTFPHAWRYRDYVIDAFNKDKPYNRFVQEQIAGDLLPAKNDQQWNEQLIATGFLTLGPKALNEQNGRQFELDLIDEQIDVTTRVMLGVSVACARCHDHKFDPIPQTDYYALSGIFSGMSTHYGTFRTQQNRRPSNLIVMPVKDQQPFEQSLTVAQMNALKEELTVKQTELREALTARRQRSTTTTSNPQQRIVQVGQASTAAGLLQAKLDAYDPKGQPLSLCMAVQETTPTNVRLLERGEFSKPAQEVPRGFPKVLCVKPVSIPKGSTGRLEFARWVGSSDNPLTARVMVNRVWQHLIGQAIVRTPEDFGSTGQPPTHPELLDYLAVQFVENDWSVKHLVRAIVTSRTYRMSSQFDRAKFEADPENRYLWRIEPKRLEAEAIRDSLLAVSGELNLQRPHGSVVAKSGTAVVRDGVLVSLKTSGSMDDTIEDRVRERMVGGLLGMSNMEKLPLRLSIESLDKPTVHRSVYLPIVRDHIPRALDVFDFAESTMVIGVRERSNTPDQGLFFLNNSFVIEQATAMAQRLVQQASELDQQIDLAFQLSFGRSANPAELSAARQFYTDFDLDQSELTRSRSNRQFGPLARGRGSRLPMEGRRGSEGLGLELSVVSTTPAIQKLTALCQSILASVEFRYIN